MISRLKHWWRRWLVWRELRRRHVEADELRRMSYAFQFNMRLEAWTRSQAEASARMAEFSRILRSLDLDRTCTALVSRSTFDRLLNLLEVGSPRSSVDVGTIRQTGVLRVWCPYGIATITLAAA